MFIDLPWTSALCMDALSYTPSLCISKDNVFFEVHLGIQRSLLLENKDRHVNVFKPR